MSSVRQFRLGKNTLSVLLSHCWATIYANVKLCCVQKSNGWTVLCPIVKMLDNALSNSQMVGQCCVQQSNGWSMLCPTVQWLVS